MLPNAANTTFELLKGCTNI